MRRSNALQKLYIFIFTIIVLIGSLGIFSASAQTQPEESAEITNFKITPNAKYLTDDSDTTSTETNTITIESDKTIKSVYIIFRKNTVPFDIACGENTHSVETDFLHSYTKLPEAFTDCKKITVTFKEKANVSRIAVFSDGTLPDWVQVWEKPYDKVDLLLTSTHADDEHLFFAGLIPYYAMEKNYRVQIAYFTNHNNNNPDRNHELLNGLWAVGVDRYPIIGPFPDMYAKTEQFNDPAQVEIATQKAFRDLLNLGFTEEKILEYQTELLRRLKPLVVIGHAFNGEYGHGQHVVNMRTLIKAVENSKDPNYFPQSAEKYGVWDTPKLYIHEYEKNNITMDWDTPYESMGGKSAFQMSQEAFKHHKSQHWTYFWNWLNGNTAKPITKSTEAKNLKCNSYGLYYTTVGQDVAKNDFFENVTTYDEKFRLEEEERKKAEEEQARLEAEAIARAEEESREAARLESERLAALQTTVDQNTSPKQTVKGVGLVISFIFLAAIVCMLGVVIFKKIR